MAEQQYHKSLEEAELYITQTHSDYLWKLY